MQPTIYLTLNTKFSACRILDGMIYPSTWKVTADLTHEDATEPTEAAIAYQKMLFWLTDVIDGALMSNIHDPLGQLLALETENTFISLPGEPTDELLCRVFSEKLSAIGKEAGLTVLGLSLAARDTSITYNLANVSNTADTGLPGIEYADGEPPAKGKKKKFPWWKKPTSDTSDLEFEYEDDPENETNIKFIPARNQDILTELGDKLRQAISIANDEPEDDPNIRPAKAQKVQPSAKVIEPLWPTKK